MKTAPKWQIYALIDLKIAKNRSFLLKSPLQNILPRRFWGMLYFLNLLLLKALWSYTCSKFRKSYTPTASWIRVNVETMPGCFLFICFCTIHITGSEKFEMVCWDEYRVVDMWGVRVWNIIVWAGWDVLAWVWRAYSSKMASFSCASSCRASKKVRAPGYSSTEQSSLSTDKWWAWIWGSHSSAPRHVELNVPLDLQYCRRTLISVPWRRINGSGLLYTKSKGVKVMIKM